MEILNHTALWDQFRQGDEKALHTLYHNWYDELFKYGWRYCGDINEAKGLINQLFADLWAGRHKLPAIDHPKAYLITCYKNKALRHKKKAGPRLHPIDETAEHFLPSASSVEETIIELQEYDQLKQKINKLLSCLTQRQQVIIRLRFIEEMSYEAISLQLDISVRTVYNSIHESLKILKKGPEE